MRKEFNMMLIVVVCAILGIVCAAILNILYTQGILADFLANTSITIIDLEFLIFFFWLIGGIVLGVMKN